MGVLCFVINLDEAVSDLLAGRIARRIGTVRAVVAARAVSVVLLSVMAVTPTFVWAAVLYLARVMVNTLSNPIRQLCLMGIVDPRDRSSAAGLANLPSQAGAAISSSVAGRLMQQVSLATPLGLATGLRAAMTASYWVLFWNIHLPEKGARGTEEAS